jgi:hypothetical protein
MKQVIALKQDFQGNYVPDTKHACPYGWRPLNTAKTRPRNLPKG